MDMNDGRVHKEIRKRKNSFKMKHTNHFNSSEFFYSTDILKTRKKERDERNYFLKKAKAKRKRTPFHARRNSSFTEDLGIQTIYDNDENGHLIIFKNSILNEQYKVKKLIGEGVYGKVYRCKDIKNKKLVAIKVLKDGDVFRSSGETEKLFLNKLHEINLDFEEYRIVQLLDSFELNNHLCLVFEHLGLSLSSIIFKEKNETTSEEEEKICENHFDFAEEYSCKGIDLKEVSIITKQLLSCLIALSNNNIIHGDLKPDNILFKNSEEKKEKKNNSKEKGITFQIPKEEIKLTPNTPTDSPIYDLESIEANQPREVISEFDEFNGNQIQKDNDEDDELVVSPIRPIRNKHRLSLSIGSAPSSRFMPSHFSKVEKESKTKNFKPCSKTVDSPVSSSETFSSPFKNFMKKNEKKANSMFLNLSDLNTKKQNTSTKKRKFNIPRKLRIGRQQNNRLVVGSVPTNYLSEKYRNERWNEEVIDFSNLGNYQVENPITPIEDEEGEKNSFFHSKTQSNGSGFETLSSVGNGSIFTEEGNSELFDDSSFLKDFGEVEDEDDDEYLLQQMERVEKEEKAKIERQKQKRKEKEAKRRKRNEIKHIIKEYEKMHLSPKLRKRKKRKRKAKIRKRQRKRSYSFFRERNSMSETEKKMEIRVIDFGNASSLVNMFGKEKNFYIQSRIYRAPETILGNKFQGKIDVWSVGVICFELFFGIPPFIGKNNFDQLSKILEKLTDDESLTSEVLSKCKFKDLYFKAIGDAEDKEYQLKTYKEFFMNEKINANNPKPKKTIEEIEADLKEIEKDEKKFSILYDGKTLKDLITNKPFDIRLTKEERKKKEIERIVFLDFLKGLLTLDPKKRFSPKQAMFHPFISGTKIEGLNSQKKLDSDSPSNSNVGKISPFVPPRYEKQHIENINFLMYEIMLEKKSFFKYDKLKRCRSSHNISESM